MILKDLKIPYLLAALLSLIALAPLPYGYYMFLKIVVTGCAGVTAYLSYQAGDRSLLVWVCAGLAILFNPIIPIYFPREIWMFFNVSAVLVFGYFFIKVRKEK